MQDMTTQAESTSPPMMLAGDDPNRRQRWAATGGILGAVAGLIVLRGLGSTPNE